METRMKDITSITLYINKLITIIGPGYSTIKGILKDYRYYHETVNTFSTSCSLEFKPDKMRHVRIIYKIDEHKYQEKIIEHDETEKLLFKLENDI